ncbi:MAG: glycosyltransferase family 39 protein [Acidobacteria bacterium]|nr:glycosyltransferase family 39 protein [Acidobacteriota bacterium]
MFIVFFSLFFFASWLHFFERAGRVGLRLSFLKTLVFGLAFITLATECLSFFGILNIYAVASFWFVSATVVILLIRRHFVQSVRAFGECVWSGLRTASFFPSVIIGLILLVTLLIALASPPNTYDSQTYHLARVAHWIQNGSVAHYPTVILRQLYQPPLAEFAILHLQILTGGDFFANLVQWFALVGCAAAASLIVAEFDLGEKLQVFAAALVLTLPGAVVQASSTQNDLVASVLVLAFFLFFLRAVRSSEFSGVGWIGGALGLALLTKGTMYLYCFPIGIFFTVVEFLSLAGRQARSQFARRIAIVLLIAAALNFGHFSRNFALFGSPVSSGEDDVRNRNLTVRMVLANVARNFAVNLGTKSQTLRNGIESSMRKAFGAELKNPDSTWLDNEFKVEYSTHEDLAGNLLHILLVTFALGLALFAARRARDDNAIYIAGLVFTIGFGVLLFSALLKWQIWAARLQLPLLMLGSVLVAYAVGKLAPRAANALLVLTFAASIPFLLFADPRRVFANDGSFVFFNESRRHKLFKNLPDAEPLYVEAVDVIRKQPNAPGAVGLHIEYNDFDYPFWGLLKRDPRARPLIFHVGVPNVSKRLAVSRPIPEFVISTRTETTIDGAEYREIWRKDVVRVLQREIP